MQKIVALPALKSRLDLLSFAFPCYLFSILTKLGKKEID